MAAGEFVYTNPEAARQAIAQIQLQAALAENKSRENIAREQTAAQRYATQSQISEREKDRQVSREDIASRSRNRSDYALDAASRERADIQYSTVLGAINAVDPLTVTELEALFVANPQLTEDYRKNLRAERDRAYKIAKSNAKNSEMAAKNYEIELSLLAKSKLVDPTAKDKIYIRAREDKNVLLDLSTGRVLPAHAQPREDAPRYSQMMERAAGGITKIEDLMAQVGRGLLAAAPVAGGAFPTAQQMQAASRAPMPRVSDLAPPPEMFGPPNRMRTFELLPPALPQPAPQFRAYDLQTLRPEYAPPVDDYYYIQQ